MSKVKSLNKIKTKLKRLKRRLHRKPTLLTDVDGVLLDWDASFKKYVEKRGYKTKGSNPKSWGMTDWINAAADQINKMIARMNGSNIFAMIPPMRDAQLILPKLANILIS